MHVQSYLLWNLKVKTDRSKLESDDSAMQKSLLLISTRLLEINIYTYYMMTTDLTSTFK